MISFSVVIIAVAISFLIALFWLAIINYKTDFLKWENNNIFSLAIGGIAVVGITGILQFIFLEDRYLLSYDFLKINRLLDNSLIFYVAIAALMEEILKSVVIWWGIKRVSINDIKDGLVIGMVVGLFFAVAENGIYFATQIDTSSIKEAFSLIIARTIFSSIAHMIFSGIMGLFIFKAITSKKSSIVILGLIVVVLVHSIFNISATLSSSYWFPAGMLLAGLFLIFLVLRYNPKS